MPALLTLSPKRSGTHGVQSDTAKTKQNTTQSAVREMVKKDFVEKYRPCRYCGKSVLDEIRELKEDGVTIGDIAVTLDISYSSVTRSLEHLGLTKRRPRVQINPKPLLKDKFRPG